MMRTAVARFYTAETMASTTGPTGTSGTKDSADRLPLIFIGIVALEIAAILTLYFAGVHFAS
jgi:hypothetical protein